MSKNYDPLTCDISFTKGTVYKDVRELGGNAYRDLKMSLSLGTSSDLAYYLKPHSKLLENCEGNEIVEELAKGAYSQVYLVKDGDDKELVIKRSHDGLIPIQAARHLFINVPRFVVKFFVSHYDITPESLEVDVYDYEKILKPFWGKKRRKIEGDMFMPYLNMALHLVDQFVPDITEKELYSKEFWKKMLSQKKHKNLEKLQNYLGKQPTPKILIPDEERYVLFDSFSNSLQTIFIQEAMRREDEVVPGKKMAYPFELISEGVIPPEMPEVMIEHILRSFETFVEQLSYEDQVSPRIPDFRPINSWKVFPPTPYEIYFAETSNLVAYKQKDGKVNVALVDTHRLHEPEGDLSYRWVETRCWMSLFLNLRFWVRNALERIL